MNAVIALARRQHQSRNETETKEPDSPFHTPYSLVGHPLPWR
jgi:hypothetical protein